MCTYLLIWSVICTGLSGRAWSPLSISVASSPLRGFLAQASGPLQSAFPASSHSGPYMGVAKTIRDLNMVYSRYFYVYMYMSVYIYIFTNNIE